MLEKLRYGYTTTAHRHSLLYHVFHVPARLRLLYDTAFVLTDTCAPNVFPTSSSRHRGAPNNTERHHQHVAEAGTKRGVLNTRSGPDQIAQELRGGLLRSDELMYITPHEGTSEDTLKGSEDRGITASDAKSQTAGFGVNTVSHNPVQVVP